MRLERNAINLYDKHGLWKYFTYQGGNLANAGRNEQHSPTKSVNDHRRDPGSNHLHTTDDQCRYGVR